jgi:DNA processing protein
MTPEVDSSLLDEARRAITAALSPTPTLLDDVLVTSGVTPHLMMAVLLELELAGRLQRHPGAKVSIIAGAEEQYG